MSDKIHSITVVFAENISQEHAEEISKAVSLYGGVISVTPNVVNYDFYTAQMRERKSVFDAVVNVLYPTKESR